MSVLATVLLALLAYLVWREHQIQVERQAWIRERGQLLNRIKPETAQVITGDEPPMFQPPHFDDDEAMRELRESWTQ